MAATTITRATVTDDSGAGTDGTIINSAWVGTAIYDKVDALFSATGGITLNQGAGDGAILSLESSDVAHGMTDLAGTAVYGMFSKQTASSGGLLAEGFSEGTIGTNVRAHVTTEDSTKSTAGDGALTFTARLKSGTTVTDMSANANIAVFKNNTAAKFILDADGDSHQDVGTAWTNFDTYDDAALLTAVSGALSRHDDPLREAFVADLEAHRHTLVSHRLVTFNDNGHHFVNWSRMNMLLVGAVRQVAQRMSALDARLGRLELTA